MTKSLSNHTLDSFMSYMEAEDEDSKKKYLKELHQKIITHINELSKKKYHTANEIKTFGFTLMFIASDSVLTTVLSVDRELLRNALKKGILIVGPTTMMATIKTLELLTREQKQMENLEQIAESGRRLYEKFVDFMNKMDDVRKALDKAEKSLTTAFNHLNRGDKSILSEAKRLKELGINSEKELD